jgi:hypothetical protein
MSTGHLARMGSAGFDPSMELAAAVGVLVREIPYSWLVIECTSRIPIFTSRSNNAVSLPGTLPARKTGRFGSKLRDAGKVFLTNTAGPPPRGQRMIGRIPGT